MNCVSPQVHGAADVQTTAAKYMKNDQVIDEDIEILNWPYQWPILAPICVSLDTAQHDLELCYSESWPNLGDLFSLSTEIAILILYDLRGL